MIILIDEDGLEVGTLDQDADADSVLVGDDEYYFEFVDGEDRVYQRRQWGS